MKTIKRLAALTAVAAALVVGSLAVTSPAYAGANVVSDVAVVDDSSATTAKGSSAVVSLGKLGRVE